MTHAGGRPLKFQSEKDFVDYLSLNIDKLPIRMFYVDREVHGELKA